MGQRPERFSDLRFAVLATDAYLGFAAHSLGGRVDPIDVEPDWNALRRERDPVAHLEAALPEQRIEASLAELELDAPSSPAHKWVLAEYRSAVREGGWQPIPSGAALEQGSLGARVDGLRGRIEREHAVIVGRRYRKTLVFKGEISYLVLNPWWETPDNLARLDKLPAFRSDPAWVQRLGFEVLDRQGRKLDPDSINWRDVRPEAFPYRLRQRPVPQNALGQVELMFPNPHNVYLNDSPQRELFVRGERAFSSGCVRVSDALGLATWVLAPGGEWTEEKIRQTVRSGEETRVNVRPRLPIYILYLTTVLDPDGRIRFIPDIYDRDGRLLEALESARDRPGSRPPAQAKTVSIEAELR